MSYSFLLQTNVRIGVEASLELATYIEQLNVKKIGVVFDSAIKATTPWERLLGVLGRSGDVVVSIENRVSEPDYAYLDECKVPLLEKPVDCVIGVGGGSTLDIAKALSVLIANPGRSIDYRGFNLVKNPGVPAITIPTTAGTGSESHSLRGFHRQAGKAKTRNKYFSIYSQTGSSRSSFYSELPSMGNRVVGNGCHCARSREFCRQRGNTDLKTFRYEGMFFVAQHVTRCRR